MIDKADIEQIYRRNFERLYAIARSIAGDEVGRDVVHDVFMKIFNFEKLPANVDAYLIVAVRNRALDAVKQMSTRRRIENSLPLDLTEIPSTVEPDRLNYIIKHELSPKVREVVEKVFFEQRSYKEAADELDLSVATINKHIVTALRKLRIYFKTSKK